MGPAGERSNDGTDGSTAWDRISRYGKWSGYVGENIAYGKNSGKKYMMQLYVDGETQYRKNILNKEYKLTGMAVCQHKGYGQMIVITYAGEFVPNDYGKKELAKRANKI